MKTYVIIPTEWDYENNNGEISHWQEQGCFTPSDIIDISERCGALVGCGKRQAMVMANKLKKDYSYVKFSLMVSEGTWGSMELVYEI